jgi:dTDP-L-rhamnose 4-epimerase
MENVAILTGGAGFIGTRLARALVGGDKRLIAVDSLHPQVHPNGSVPTDFPKDVELIVADVTDRIFWDQFLEKYCPTDVIHLAAETGTGQSLSESTRHAHVNVVGTAQMLDAFSRNNRIPGHIVLASSRAVYGEGAWQAHSGEVFYPLPRSHSALASGNWDIGGPGGKAATPLAHNASKIFPKPASVYGATKLTQENIVECWAAAMGVSATIFRFQNVYGPGQSPFNPYTGIITLFHRIASNGGVIEVYEDGRVGRDFVYIDDVIAACVAAFERPAEGTRCIDVGTGNVTTIVEAATCIASIYGAPPPEISGRFRDGDIRWAVADTNSLHHLLGIHCKTSFVTDGVFRVGEWLRAQGII